MLAWEKSVEELQEEIREGTDRVTSEEWQDKVDEILRPYRLTIMALKSVRWEMERHSLQGK